ncbi:MAG: YadA C-terminal domain-containing protein [Megasphaera sp.]|uniref:YadA C-terminal domain-containing protein n=1 Tax=Megasphaera sp. TaxID=2023260 RepID=UPI003F0A0A4B
MKLSGKKLTTAILAGLMGASMFGGSVFAEVTDQEFNEVRQGVNSNTQRISQLENAQQQAKDYSKDIDANKKAISDETTARTAADTKLQSSVDANAKAITDEATARTAADTKLQSSVDANTKAISDEATARDKAVAQERAERKGADAAQDKVIKQVNDNLVSSVGTINKNIGTITDQLNKNDLAEQQARAAADKAEADARAASDTKLQDNIDNEAAARQKDVSNLQKNITDSLASQGKINETLTTAVQNNSKAIVDSAKNLEKHLTETDGRVDKANAEIHTNAGNIAQNKQDIVAIQNTLKDANAVASSDATKAANKAASDATAAANNANTVAKGLNDRITLISNNQNVTSESDLIKKDHSIGQNLTNVDAALHNEISARIGADAAQDKVINTLNKNVTDGFNAINTTIGTVTDQLNKNDLAEQQTRAAADKTLQDNIDAEATARDQAVAQERAERKGADAAQDKVIKQVNDNLVSSVDTINKNIGTITDQLNKNDLAEQQTRAAADKTLQDNIDAEATARDQAVAQERAERKGADAAQDKVIKQVNDNLVSSVNTINKNVADGFNALSAVDLQEAQTRAAADQELQKNINAEADARDKADQKEAATRQAADQNLQNQINNNGTSINDLYGRYSSLKTDINKVGARSAALAGLHPLDFDPANKLNFAVASGSFKGENSVALGAFYRPNENIMFSAASTMGDSDNAYTFGLSFKIGPSSAKTKTTSPDAEELYKVVGQLQDQLAAQQKEIEQLKADKAK